MIRNDFASDEEWHVYNWLKEARSNNLVRNLVYQPGPFELAPRASVRVFKKFNKKIKEFDKFLFHPHTYTPDFEFTIDCGYLSCVFKHPDIGMYGDKVIIDVKGNFNKFGDQKQFVINQKMMWQKFGIYVEKIVPEKLFKKTWVPEICRFTPKQHKPVKKYAGCLNIREFLEKIIDSKKGKSI